MSFAALRQTIETRLSQQWVTGSPSTPRTPIGFDGQAFEPVKNSIRLTILDGEGRNASIGAPGSNLVRHAGVIAIQVFTEGGKGTAASRAYEDQIATIFRNWTSGNLRCGVPYIGGTVEEPPFMVRTVMIPFTVDNFNG